jgi:hypothetical protein
MSMRLMYISNDAKIGKIAESAGVDWIFVDLEYIGKEKRQANRNTVISAHTIEDIKNMRAAISKSELLVRINPLGEYSKEEIENVINAGADIIMLPFFKTKEEVKTFLKYVNGRVKTCLLVETMSAVEIIDEILELKGIDFIHIGLNDIHIERQTNFMFEFLADGYIDILAEKIKKKEIPFGFGGVAHMDSDLLPLAKDIISEHYRLGSSGVILSRSFIQYSPDIDIKDFEKEFINRVRKLRNIEKNLPKKDEDFFRKNKEIVIQDIYKVRDMLRAKNAR